MKYLLSVGINQYDKSIFGSIDLAQCINDTNNINDSIACNELCHLTDRQATKYEVVSNLRYYADKCQSGDTFIYFQSSHGTKYDKTNKVITGRVMYDNVLWDYEMLDLLTKFKKGVNVILMSDLCHSESNSKNTGFEITIKSTETNLVPMEYSTTKVSASVVMLSACTFNAYAIETPQGGIFTNSLIKNITQKVSWKKLVSLIKKDTVQHQTPVLEHIKASNKLSKQHGIL